MHPYVHPQRLHHPHAAGARPALMRFDDFCFAYDDVPVLRHIDLEIDAGDSVVLMGDNGSGKSTLLRAMSGLVHPQVGTYRFDGRVVDAASMRDPEFSRRLHQRVGFIFQDSDSMLFTASVEDEVAFGPSQMGLSAKEVSARVDDCLGLLGIGHLRGRAPYNLSGGEKKKVAIASVLAMNPEALCLDEPMAALDARTQEWLLGFLKQLKHAGKTLVVATHDQSAGISEAAEARRQDAGGGDARPVPCGRARGLLRVHGRLPRVRRPAPRARERVARRCGSRQRACAGGAQTTTQRIRQ